MVWGSIDLILSSELGNSALVSWEADQMSNDVYAMF